MIFYKPENSIRNMKPFWRLLFCHSKIVKDTSVLQKWTRNKTWLPNITEIASLNLLAGSAPMQKRMRASAGYKTTFVCHWSNPRKLSMLNA